MKYTKIIKAFLFIIGLHVLVACNHDFLNTDPATEFPSKLYGAIRR